jgi:hypothetical protein
MASLTPISSLSNLQSASLPHTLNNGNNAQTWNWRLTTDPQTGFQIGESAASINGAGTQNLFEVSTLANSTANPFVVTMGSQIVFFIDASGNVSAAGLDSATAPGAFQLLAGNAASGSNTVGGGVAIASGAGDGTGSGTDMDIYGGAAGANCVAGKGGDCLVWGGAGGNTAAGGSATLVGGPPGSNSRGGDCLINPASAAGAGNNRGGQCAITCGNATGNADGGDVKITTGTSPTGTHGAVKLLNAPLYCCSPAFGAQTAIAFFAGTGAPNNANGNNGDIYSRSDGGALTTIYQKRAGAWVGIV